jgi:hypothetical protein
MNILKLAAAVVTALVTIIGGAWAVDNHFARKVEVAELGKAFQQYQTESSLDKTTDRLWNTEDRLKKQPGNEELQAQRRELMERKRRLEIQLHQIEKEAK